MLKSLTAYLKFFIKIKVVSALRDLFLFYGGKSTERRGWENRLLVVFLQAIGDAVVLTSVLKHYRMTFPGKKLYILIPTGKGIDGIVQPFVDEVLLLRYGAFVANPFYGFSFVNRLRTIGFKTVIDQNHSPAEVSGKSIANSVGASAVYGYEGFLLPFERPFDVNMALTVRYVRKSLYPRFTRLVPSADRRAKGKMFNHLIEHYATFFEAISGKKDLDYSTTLKVNPASQERVGRILKNERIAPGSYVVVNPGSSQNWKNWPIERFSKAAAILETKKIPVVLVGAPGEERLGASFRSRYRGRCLDLIGRTAIAEIIALIDRARMVLTNDTSAVHIAVALKRPSIAILGGGHFGKISLYGYSDINKWVYTETGCFGDNWRCARDLRGGEVAPCIEAVTVKQVGDCVAALLEYLSKTRAYPRRAFQASYLS